MLSFTYLVSIFDLAHISYIGISIKCVDVEFYFSSCNLLDLIPVKLNEDFQLIRIFMNLDQ